MIWTRLKDMTAQALQNLMLWNRTTVCGMPSLTAQHPTADVRLSIRVRAAADGMIWSPCAAVFRSSVPIPTVRPRRFVFR